MAAPLLTLNDITLTLGGKPLLAGSTVTISEGERLCLVGRNGSGKSSFLKIMAGLVEADGGERITRAGTTLRYLPQEPDFSGYETVEAYVEGGLEQEEGHHRARQLIEALGLDGNAAPALLSGGEQRRAALARTLAPEPDILLLDEPTNHLDLPTIEWLETRLRSIRSAMVLVSHDRRFLEGLSQATIWLDRGKCRRLSQGFGGFEEWRDTVLAEEEMVAHKLARKIADEEHWLRYGVTARRKRNERRVGLLSQLREELRERRQRPGSVTFSASEGKASGALVLEARDISKSFGNQPVVANFSLRLARGSRLAVVGANGAGKTTLLRLLLGELAPDSGMVRLGSNLTTVLVDQKREALAPGLRLAEALTGGGSDQVMVNGQARHVVSYMKDFLFPPEAANTPVSVLSGGERARLALARALSLPVNLLVLDEPTNDLDLETLDLLQERLADHPATVLLVSHDRDFIDRVATSVLVAEGNGKFVEYAGGYSDMVAQRRAPIQAVKATPDAGSKRPSASVAPGDNGNRQPMLRHRLTNQEREALRLLPARIDQLNATAARLRALIEDPTLFTRDRASFERTTSLLAETEAQLAKAEDVWLSAELRRAEIDA